MRTFKWLFTLATLCTLIPSAKPQTKEWHSVETLHSGTAISVAKKHGRLGCELVNVTSSELICNKTIGEITRTYIFERAQVREVRLEDPEHNQMITGTVIGAVLGGVLGIAGGNELSDPEARGYSRFYGIPAGAFLGRAIGHAIHRHGAVVYQQR